MSKAYWISTYQKINDPDKLLAYAALAGPAITAGGGKFIVRGMPVKTYEAGLNERTVVIEFGSVDAAIATHDSPDYAAALALAPRIRQDAAPSGRGCREGSAHHPGQSAG